MNQLKAQPKEITTTDEVLEEAVKKTLEKEPEVKKRKPRKKPVEKKEPVKKLAKKTTEKKPQKRNLENPERRKKMEVPNKVFKCRAQDDNGDYQWVDKTTSDYFSGKKDYGVFFGAFTPI